MTLRIRIEHGQNAGHAWRLAQPGVYVLGRTPAASLQVLDMKISKDHCRFIVRTQGDRSQTALEDNESRHGTQLNGQPVNTRKVLKPGDEIRVGLSILRVLSDDPQAEDAVPTSESTEALATRAPGVEPAAKKRKTFAKDDVVGTEMGGYRVLEKIGQGGMGSVYIAEQLSLHREVALKVLGEKFKADSAFVDQFVNEARSAAALNHPNVVQVYDVGQANGRYYFSMEFVNGGSIEERLAEAGAQSWRDALNWMIDASNALIFAQKRDILHRDVKPDNLMLAEDGSAKLCDLGLAKKAANADMLAAGIIGTPAFISPEAIRRKKDIDGRSDLYSLGCTFYRILTGENPYPAKSVKEILMGHLKAPVPRVSAKVPDVPRELDDVIHTLMQKEADERFESAQDLLQALDRIRVQHGLEAHGLRPASRKPLVIALVAVLVLAGGALAFILSRDTEPQTVTDPDQVRREKELKERLAREAFRGFVDGAEKDLAAIELREARGNLRISDNWANDTWTPIVEDYRSFAEDLEKNEEYGSTEEAQTLVAKARGLATKIEKYVELRRRADQSVKKARQDAIEAFTQEVTRIRQEFDKAFEAKAWVKAFSLVAPEALEKLVKTYVEKQVVDALPDAMSTSDRAQFEDTLLLDEAEHIRPLLDKHLPGETVGAKLRDQLTAAAAKAHADFEKEVDALVKKNTHEDLEKALARVDAYLEALPATVDASAGDLAPLLGSFREQAELTRGGVEDAECILCAYDLRHDQVAYGLLLRTLRAPKGLLFRFELEEAQKVAASAVEGMRDERYVALAKVMQADVQALAALFDRLAATFPDGWSEGKVRWEDERGREESERVKAVDAQGLDLGGERVSYAKLGPAFLLDRVFRTKDGWRFPLEGEDHRGMAVLAEMAVDFDEVMRQYQAYAAWLPADRMDTQQAIRRRLGQRMLLERQAAEAWKTATGNLATVNAVLDAHDPELIGEEEFWDDKSGREEFVARKRELNGLLDQARRAQATLQDPRYATTVWGAAVREGSSVGILFAGETMPTVPEDGGKDPEKDPEKKPDGEPGKDADEGDDGKAPDDASD